MRTLRNFFVIILACFFACNTSEKKENKSSDSKLEGNLTIFHAGSLSVPMKEISAAFMKENPNVKILLEAAGSVECARKISELKKPCDIMASADYKVIDKMLIPEFADWNIKFASNEMAIVYTEKSKKSNEITKDNWYKIMLEKEVLIGRADPNADPCGYRAALVSMLAEKYYNQKGLASQLMKKDKNNIRPKETDLLALLESGNVDYIFLYRSVAEQHKLKCILLPDEVNLKNPKFTELYNSVSVEINGKKPGEKISQKGEPMVYGITIPKCSTNKAVAMAFVKYLLTKEKGIAILEKLGQPSVVPSSTLSFDKIPEDLKQFASKSNN